MNKEIDNLFEELKKIGKLLTFKKNDIIVNINDIANKLYLIIEGGMILSYINTKTGEEKAINFFIPDFHPLCTVSESYYLKEPSKYILKTFTKTEVIEITRTQLDDFIKNSDFTPYFHHHTMINMLEKNQMRVMLLSLDSLEMFKYLHKNFPQILQNIPSKYVANYLGISPQWLSKLKHQL